MHRVYALQNVTILFFDRNVNCHVFKIHKLAFNAENVSEIRVYNDFVRYRQIYIL